MSVAEFIKVVLMAFVLLAPTMMVAVLVSGLSRRAALPDGAERAGGGRRPQPHPVVPTS